MQVRILLTSNLLKSSALLKRRFPAEGETPFAYLIRSLAHTRQYVCALMIVVLSWMADFNLWHQDAGYMYDDEYGCYQWFKDTIFESNSQRKWQIQKAGTVVISSSKIRYSKAIHN